MSKESEVEEINPRIGERNCTLDWDGIDPESLDRLKRTRGAKKGIVTKAQNEIRELMLDFGNIELFKRKVEEESGRIRERPCRLSRAAKK